MRRRGVLPGQARIWRRGGGKVGGGRRIWGTAGSRPGEIGEGRGGDGGAVEWRARFWVP